MRRVVCIFAVLCIVLGNLSVAGNESPLSSSEDALATLKGLQIVIDYEMGERAPFDIAKKYTIINFLMNMVDDEHFGGEYNETALKKAESLGVIDSAAAVSEGDKLKYNEMIKMGICVLGYKDIVEYSGGYPDGYNRQAVRLGLVKNGISDEDVTNREMFEFLWNVINADYMKQVEFGDEWSKYAQAEGAGILAEYRHIYEVCGIVDANEMSGLFDYSNAKKGYISINGVQYLCEDMSYNKLLGYGVRAYIKINYKNTPSLVYAAVDSKVKVKSVNVRNIMDISDDFSVVKYFERDEDVKEKNLKMDKPVSFIKNGKAYPDYSKSDFADGAGILTFIDNNSDGIYDVVRTEKYESMVVDSVSLRERQIHGKYSSSALLNLVNLNDFYSSGGTVSVYFNGEPAELDVITSGCEVDVFQTSGSGINNIVIYANSLSKEATISYYNQNEETVKAGNEEYKLASAYYAANAAGEAYAADIRVGAKYTLFFNMHNEIMGIKKGGSNDYERAYLRKAAIGDNMFDESVLFRLLSDDGNWVTVELADKVRMNGENGKKPEAIKNFVENNGLDGGMIFYKLNEDGKIFDLQTPVPCNENGNDGNLNVTQEMDLVFRWGNRSFNSQWYFADGAVVYIVPDTESDNEELYTVGTWENLTADLTYTFKGYDVDEYCFMNYVVIKEDSASCKAVMKTTDYLVTDVVQVLSADGSLTSSLYVSSNSYAKMQLMGESVDTFQAVHKGDVIKCHINMLGYVDNVSIVHAVSDGAVKYEDSNLNMLSSVIKGRLIKVDREGGRIIVDSGIRRTLKIPSATKAIIYDVQRDYLIYGTLADVEIGDYVISDSRSSQVNNFILLRNY